MAIISFENLADDGEFAVVPDGFRRLNWDNFIAIDANYFDDKGGGIATNAIHTGEAAGYSAGGRVLSFESPNRDDDFDLNNGYFTAVVGTGSTNDATVKVFGFDDSERVAKKVL